MIGSVINGRYAIVAELGEGGMASVFEARDTRLQREVAIKILHPHIAKHEEFCRRFHQEAAIAARLVHPNIVQIYDYGTSEDGRTFIVSELIRGRDFHQLQVERLKVEGRPFHPIFCALICEEILKALEVAHKQSFIHRDVKPDNVMVAEDGSVKLTDFGIAKNMGSSLTVAGHFLGSPVYSSPEQVQGDHVDFRSDLFAVGIILYEALTGSLPFSGKNASEVMMRIVQGSYTPLSSILAGTPPELEAIIEHAMASHPNERFSSTSDMGQALRKYLASCGIESSRSGLEAYFRDPGAFLTRHERIYEERLHRTAPTAAPLPQEGHVRIEVANARDPRRISVGKKSSGNRQQPSQRRTVAASVKRHTPVAHRNYRVDRPKWRAFLMLTLTFLLLVSGAAGYLVWEELPLSVRKQTLNRIAPQTSLTPTSTTELPPIAISQNTPAEALHPTAKPTLEPRPTQSPPSEPRRVAQQPVRTPSPTRKPEVRVATIATPRPQPTAEPVAPAPLPGRIALQTVPAGANLFIDGKPMGTTGAEGQIRAIELKAGTHTLAVAGLEVSGVRYGGVEKRVYVEAGKQVSLGTLRLTPFRTLTISIAGPSVVVRVNGDPYPMNGKPLALSLPEGKVEIRAKAGNGKTLERSINLKGENFTFNASLE